MGDFLFYSAKAVPLSSLTIYVNLAAKITQNSFKLNGIGSKISFRYHLFAYVVADYRLMRVIGVINQQKAVIKKASIK
ncbi:hypothetical protein [Croceitalea vernalis]|uniref:Uncharacterized protein n=1 Tax=Croceitalea vernalis TaxID=3075599 RepID=A0ABU3BKU0_9FLAO|nr:hypothetical protein [Croceitalea sp. P007]MDT0622775.1 hypothetical protein [Croceitalea sp. P007]